MKGEFGDPPFVVFVNIGCYSVAFLSSAFLLCICFSVREVAVPPKSSVDAASFCGLFLYFVIPSHCLFIRMIEWTMTPMQKSSLALTCANFNLARVRGSIILTSHSTVEIPSVEICIRANLIA